MESSEEDFLILGGGKYFCRCSSLFPVKVDSWKFLSTFGLGFLPGAGDEITEETVEETAEEKVEDMMEETVEGRRNHNNLGNFWLKRPDTRARN